MREVTDPNEIARIEQRRKIREVTDPELLKKIDGLSSGKAANARKEINDLPLKQKVENFVRGFAGRGDEMSAAFSLYPDLEKLQRQKEWINNAPWAGAGYTLADIISYLPSAIPGSIPGRALASAATAATTLPGNTNERLNNAAWSAGMSAVGDKVGEGVGFLVKPFKNVLDDAGNALVRKAENLGLKPNAAQRTGDKALQYIDKALDYVPSSAGPQKEFKAANRKAWQRAVFNAGHETADSATSDVMGAMKDRISNAYKSIASKHDIIVDRQLKDSLDNIATQYGEIIPVNQKSIVKKYLRDFNPAPQGAMIKGTEYQRIRSMLDKQAKALRNSDPATSEALSSIRTAVDEAMERTLTAKGAADDVLKWRQANNDWMVMRNIEYAADPVTGEISERKFISNLKRKDPNRVIYGRGNQELTDIAKVGKEFIMPKTIDSGTAQTRMAIDLITGAGLGGLAYDAYQNPDRAAMNAGAGLLGAVLLPRMVGGAMRSPNGYFTQGLLNIDTPLLSGYFNDATGRKAIREIFRNTGARMAND